MFRIKLRRNLIMSEKKEQVTAGSILASILKGEEEFSEEDLTRQMMKQLPNATTVTNGTLIGTKDENGEIVIEDCSVQNVETIQ